MALVDFVSADDVLLPFSLHLNFNVENCWLHFRRDGDASGGS